MATPTYSQNPVAGWRGFRPTEQGKQVAPGGAVSGWRNMLQPVAGGKPAGAPHDMGGGGKQGGMVPDAAVAPPASTPTMGTESGPGILENWFQQRSTGTDPAYEYTLKRGGDAIDRRMAAGGSFNSGARGEQLSDFGANMGAQRQGQLDSLAAGAAGEHRGRLQDMFGIMSGLAGGQAGLAGAYDLTAAKGMSDSDNAILQMLLNKAGVDGKADQGFLNNLFSAITLGQGGGKRP
jgi:hypothetical protein